MKQEQDGVSGDVQHVDSATRDSCISPTDDGSLSKSICRIPISKLEERN